MLGLFGILNLGARSLQTQQVGVEVTGHNLANVNNPAYARQRVLIQTTDPVSTSFGPQGTGAQVVSIQQLRSDLIDAQLRGEQSVGGYWQALQTLLQNAQAGLGEFLDRNADNVGSAALAGGAGAAQGLADQITGLFNAFQSLATSPASDAARQALISQAQLLSTRFNQVAGHLTDLRASLNASLDSDVTSVNQLLSEIAGLNDQIATAELPQGERANDLRDLREAKLEELSKLVNFDTSNAPDGSVDISIGGSQVVAGNQLLDTLQTYDAGGGQMLIRTVTSATPLTLTGGSIQGTIDGRDGTLLSLQNSLDALAGTLITQVNAVHSTGFSLTGSTGANFFSGTDAATISVNPILAGQPSLIQASGISGETGNNTVALALAQLSQQLNGPLNNQTFSAAYGQIVGDFGNALKSANDQLASNAAVNSMLLQQRDSVSGVSIDEEMTNLMMYQRAYQASARIVTTADDMLDTVLNMKR
jgi:flagellar hook-associated protein 1 FlgK